MIDNQSKNNIMVLGFHNQFFTYKQTKVLKKLLGYLCNIGMVSDYKINHNKLEVYCSSSNNQYLLDLFNLVGKRNYYKDLIMITQQYHDLLSHFMRLNLFCHSCLRDEDLSMGICVCNYSTKDDIKYFCHDCYPNQIITPD